MKNIMKQIIIFKKLLPAKLLPFKDVFDEKSAICKSFRINMKLASSPSNQRFNGEGKLRYRTISMMLC